MAYHDYYIPIVDFLLMHLISFLDIICLHIAAHINALYQL